MNAPSATKLSLNSSNSKISLNMSFTAITIAAAILRLEKEKYSYTSCQQR